MTVLMVPEMGGEWPTLGAQVCAWIEEYLVFGPGDLRGEPARLDDEKRALIYRMYEIYPQGTALAGRRRFKRCSLSLRKGTAKTELAAWLAAVELHPDSPVRCDGFDAYGNPVGVGVTDPYIPLVAYTEEQSDELAYGALLVILQYSPLVGDFDIGLERIMRAGGDGKAVSLSTSPSARDGARTTFQVFDEPLALDTPVPTTDGWKMIGEIEVGDSVFDRYGHSVEVIGLSPVHTDRQCYRVTFTGGDTIVTDSAHRWKVIEWSNRPAGEQVRTTEEMYQAGVDTGYGNRWRLPRHSGYDGTHRELPIDPYVLGVWLGDGSTDAGYVHAGDQDVDELMALLEAAGYSLTISNDTHERATRFLLGGLRAQLTATGLRGDKHIPENYAFASREQRLALLQGLMDTDGHASKTGHCTFVQGRRRLAEDVRSLVRSLGMRASLNISEDDRSRTGLMHKVHFTPDGCIPFRLARKAERCREDAHHSLWPVIVSIEPCDPVPVRCLAVDSEDHLFLVGKGLRLTHNTHRFTSPRLRAAHKTMQANIYKRRLSDPWSFEITTAFSPGEGSVAEDTMDYARMVEGKQVEDSRLFFFHRQASDEHDLSTPEGVHAAVIEASGPAVSWSDIDGICSQWADPTTDKSYLERVWCNRPVQASERAFDVERWAALADPEHVVPDKAKVALGFDGARWRDATALVGTEILTGFQFLVGFWERPENVQDWEVAVGQVDAAMRLAFDTWDVWRLYADPPYYESLVAEWAGRYGEQRVVEWWTNRHKAMAYAIKAYNTAIVAGELSNDGSAHMKRHIGNACKHPISLHDEKGQQMFLIYKEKPESPHKIDAAMAGILSWEARNDAIAAGVGQMKKSAYEARGLVVAGK